MKQRDIIFKVGLGLQLLLIPLAFLWHFSPEANYYNLVLAVCFLLVVVSFFWPQTLLGRLKRLRAIKVQFVMVIILLVLSWGAYAYFYHFSRTNCTPSYALHNGEGSMLTTLQQRDLGKNCYFGPPSMERSQSSVIYSVDWQPIFGRRWVMLLGPGINPLVGVGMTFSFLALPFANLYRYTLDRKRIQGIKKEDLFV